jgi:hypothetical protein
LRRYEIARKALPGIVAAALLSCILCYINGMSGVVPLICIVAASITCVFSILFLLSSNRQNYDSKMLYDSFVDYLRMLTYYRRIGISQFKSMHDASEETESEKLRATSQKAFKRYIMGESFLDYLVSLKPLRERLGSICKVADPGEIVRKDALFSDLKRAEMEESAQRYATINMFISTILPSFLVFAFVGNAVLSGAGFSTFVFSITFLIMVPLAYAFGNAFMWRRLLA